MVTALLLLLALANPAQANEVYFGYGVGVFNDAKQYLGQNKIIEVGYRHMMIEGLYWQTKIGYLAEGSSDSTRNSTFFTSAGVGLQVAIAPFEFRSGWGLAAISSPDSQLGARFPQFNGEAYWGVRDKYGNGGGLQYEHLSCGSFCSPNQGRDMGMLVLSHRF